MPGIIGKKLGMSQLLSDEGKIVPVTFLVCEPNTVYQVKTVEKDGYNAIVLGADPLKKPKKTKKYRTMKEFLFLDTELKKDDHVNVEIFEKDDSVTIKGISKGKGFQGRVRRHNMHPTRKSHGTKYIRHGSTGQCAMPGRTWKGTKMPGRMGCDQVTLKKRKIVSVDLKRNIIAVKGSVPGAKDSLVYIQKES